MGKESRMDFVVDVSEEQLRQERAKARELRKSRWWQNRIAAGRCQTCGILRWNGNGYCWGDNNQGQLGDNEASGPTSSSPVQVSGGLNFARIVGGYYHTCGRVGTNLYCWGQSAQGQLGNGTRGSNVLTPVQIKQ